MEENNQTFDLDIFKLLAVNIKFLKRSIAIILCPIAIVFVNYFISSPIYEGKLTIVPNIDTKWLYTEKTTEYFKKNNMNNASLINYFEANVLNRIT